MRRRDLLLGGFAALVGGSVVRAAGRGHHEVISFAPASTKAIQPRALLYLPAEYDEKKRKKWPLLVWLHGASGRGTNLDLVKRYGPPAVAERRGDFPFVVVSPQCPPGQLWSDAGAIVGLTDYVESAYRIDRKKVYLTGLSMGGGGTWFVASQYPKRYAAIVPMCGPTQPAQWAQGLREVKKIWCFHGERDELIPVERSKEMVKAIKKAGGKAKLTVLKGRPHDITSEYSDDRVYKWLLKQKRKV